MDNKKANNLLKTIFFCASLILPELLHARLLDKGFEYTYSLSKNDFTVAHIKRKLSISENNLVFTSYAYPVGFASFFINDTITEKSNITNNNNILLPQSYSYVKKSEQIKEQYDIQFDRKNNSVTDSRINKPFKLTTNTFDTLSFQLALAKTLNNSRPDLTFTLIDNKHLKTYKIETKGEEQLQTEAGLFNTLKFTYYDKIKKRNVIIWCAKQLDYLPVQIKRIDNDGDYRVLKLISLKPQNTSDLNFDNEENNNDF